MLDLKTVPFINFFSPYGLTKKLQKDLKVVSHLLNKNSLLYINTSLANKIKEIAEGAKGTVVPSIFREISNS